MKSPAAKNSPPVLDYAKPAMMPSWVVRIKAILLALILPIDGAAVGALIGCFLISTPYVVTSRVLIPTVDWFGGDSNLVYATNITAAKLTLSGHMVEPDQWEKAIITVLVDRRSNQTIIAVEHPSSSIANLINNAILEVIRSNNSFVRVAQAPASVTSVQHTWRIFFSSGVGAIAGLAFEVHRRRRHENNCRAQFASLTGAIPSNPL